MIKGNSITPKYLIVCPFLYLRWHSRHQKTRASTWRPILTMTPTCSAHVPWIPRIVNDWQCGLVDYPGMWLGHMTGDRKWGTEMVWLVLIYSTLENLIVVVIEMEYYVNFMWIHMNYAWTWAIFPWSSSLYNLHLCALVLEFMTFSVGGDEYIFINLIFVNSIYNNTHLLSHFSWLI